VCETDDLQGSLKPGKVRQFDIEGSHASWKVLDFFPLKFQDLESPGKSFGSWKVLEKLLPPDVIF